MVALGVTRQGDWWPVGSGRQVVRWSFGLSMSSLCRKVEYTSLPHFGNGTE